MTNLSTSQKLTSSNSAGASCRLLGLPADAQTTFAFPHANNACYAVDPACPVRSEHQISYCLSAAHRGCRLYRSYQGLEDGDPGPSEAELKAILNFEAPRRTRLWSVLGFVAALLLAGVAFSFSADILASLASGAPAQAPAIQAASPTPPLTPMAAGPATAQPLFLPLVPDSPEATPAPTSLPSSQASSSSPLLSSPTPTLPSPPAPQATSSSPLPSSPASCGPPAGWVQYTVQSGDSLYGLSVAVGASLDQLRQANCLVVGGLIYTGQRLYLPRLPAPTAQPSRTPTDPPDPTETPAPTETELPAPTATEAPPTATQPPPTDSPPTEPPPTETALPEPTATPPPTRMATPTLAPTPTPLPSTQSP